VLGANIITLYVTLLIAQYPRPYAREGQIATKASARYSLYKTRARLSDRNEKDPLKIYSLEVISTDP
jgi:hypothetical protein